MSSRRPVYEANILDVINSLKERIDSMERRETVPIGSILPFAGRTIPIGYLLCDGASYNRFRTGDQDGYPELFSVIGTTYGYGSGEGTFQVPDLRGRFPLGQDVTTTTIDNGDAMGGTGGEVDHTLTTAELPAHTHPPSAAAFAVTNFIAQVAAGTDFAAVNGQGSATESSGSGQSHNNMPPYVVVKYVIAAL